MFRNQVEHLTDLKKAHLKAQKKALKQQAQAEKAAAIWKKKTFKLSRRSSKANTGTNTPAMGGLSRVNSGINTFIPNGLSRRSTEVNTGANTPAMGGLSRRSSGSVSGNEDDNDTDDDEPDEDEDDDEDEEDVEDEEDTLGGLTQLSRKSSEVRHENEFPLQHSTTVLNGTTLCPETHSHAIVKSTHFANDSAYQLPSSTPPSRRPSLSNALRKLSISGIRRRSTIPDGEVDGGSPAGDGSPSAPISPGLRRRG